MVKVSAITTRRGTHETIVEEQFDAGFVAVAKATNNHTNDRFKVAVTVTELEVANCSGTPEEQAQQIVECFQQVFGNAVLFAIQSREANIQSQNPNQLGLFDEEDEEFGELAPQQ